MAYTKIRSWLGEQLNEIGEARLFKEDSVVTTRQDADIETTGGATVHFCANNYLEMVGDTEVITVVKQGLDTHGFGLLSVRFICCTMDIHKTLERRISEFLGTEDTILYTSCFVANTGLFETLLGRENATISDALIHASIIEGIRLCRAQRQVPYNIHRGHL